MKKILVPIIGLLFLLGFSACGGIDFNDDEFEVSYLYGRWQEGTVYERYDSSGDGATWDEGDEVYEEEAQTFKWTLDGSTLIHEHTGIFVSVPKVYTVTSLTPTTLSYRDDYGTSHHFTKVN